MTSDELNKIALSTGLTSRGLARLIGYSPKTATRGIREGSATELLLRAIQQEMEGDAASAQSLRALMTISARNTGLRGMLTALLKAYVTLDRLHVYSPK